MTAYYNEINHLRAEWLRAMIRDGLIPDGVVDERDIWDVKPIELMGYTQCHFFAGVGGWPIALRLAGWPDDRPVWTGSCPCQPFSQVGKRKGFADKRHLWPAWFWLIEQCRPPVIFGEQVASNDGLVWLDLVSSDLEGAGYSIRAADLCAAGVGAPHIRQRLWFCGMADGDSSRWADAQRGPGPARKARRGQFDSSMCGVGDPDSYRCKTRGETTSSVGYGNTFDTAGWDDCDWVFCADGKYRPIEPGIRPLAYGLPNPSPAIAPYGDAIVPQVAALFIEAAIGC